MTDGPLTGTPADRLAAGSFLLIDKPRGPSSHQVTAWVRDLLSLEKAGHAGTLDPNVSGLLWVGVGPALKLLPLVLEFPKRYVGLVAFHAPVAASDLDRVVREFLGPIFQTPPVRSAVKRERRSRTLYRLDVVESEGPRALLDVTADSGTYVRTLAVDLGEALGVGAHLEELRRVGTGPFRESSAIAMTALADAVAEARAGRPEPLVSLLHPMEEVWSQFPQVRLKPAAAAAVVHGADVARGGIEGVSRNFAADAHVVLLGPRGELLAFGRAAVDAKELSGRRPGWVVDTERVFAEPSAYGPLWRRRAAPS